MNGRLLCLISSDFRKGVMEEEEWLSQANCKNADIHDFFILRGDHHQREKRNRAYGICRACPVKMQCLDYAIVNGETGIWGGTTERERRWMKRNYTPLTTPRKRLRLP